MRKSTNDLLGKMEKHDKMKLQAEVDNAKLTQKMLSDYETNNERDNSILSSHAFQFISLLVL